MYVIYYDDRRGVSLRVKLEAACLKYRDQKQQEPNFCLVPMECADTSYPSLTLRGSLLVRADHFHITYDATLALPKSMDLTPKRDITHAGSIPKDESEGFAIGSVETALNALDQAPAAPQRPVVGRTAHTPPAGESGPLKPSQCVKRVVPKGQGMVQTNVPSISDPTSNAAAQRAARLLYNKRYALKVSLRKSEKLVRSWGGSVDPTKRFVVAGMNLPPSLTDLVQQLLQDEDTTVREEAHKAAVRQPSTKFNN